MDSSGSPYSLYALLYIYTLKVLILRFVHALNFEHKERSGTDFYPDADTLTNYIHCSSTQNKSSKFPQRLILSAEKERLIHTDELPVNLNVAVTFMTL